MKTYGVKSYYRWTVSGRKLSKLEERIVLFKARSFDQAILKAEKEAKKYSEEGFSNPFGLKVKIKVLGFFDAYEIYDDLTNGCEIFSSMTLLEKPLSDKAVLLKVLDLDQKDVQKRENTLSMYFRNIEFNASMNEKDYLRKTIARAKKGQKSKK